jgi:hypothetical protein
MFQTPDGTSRMEAGNISPTAEAAEPLTPTPPPPFDQHQAYKFITTAPPRDPSPPPSYDEAIRAMIVMAASTPGDRQRMPVSMDTVPEPSPQHQSANVTASIPANLTPRPYPSTTIALSPSALSQPSTLSSSPSSALALSSPSDLTSEQESAPVIQTLSGLTQPSASVHPTQPALTQISDTLVMYTDSTSDATDEVL